MKEKFFEKNTVGSSGVGVGLGDFAEPLAHPIRDTNRLTVQI
jgi:hypothetical protein